MLFSFSSVKNKYVFCMMGGAALLLSPAAAHAGFEWTLPPAQEQAAEPASPPKAVEGPLTPELDSALPVPVESVDVAPVAPVVPKEPVKAAEPELLVETPAVAPIAKEIPVEPKVTVPEVASPVVEGFGKEIPLALALRDIVPPTYAFAFGSGDVAGVKISWRGGKPWQQVLEAALTPAGLKYSVGEKVVMVSKSDVGTPPSVAAPAPSPAPAPISAPVSGYKARMTSPDTIIRENPVAAAPVVEAKKQENPAPLTIAPAEAKPSVPVLDMATKTKWEARPGSTLRQVLESWCKIAGVELNWSTPYDYPVSNAFYFEGTYNEAISSLLSSYGGESPAPKGRLYPNLPDGPSVLMIN